MRRAMHSRWVYTTAIDPRHKVSRPLMGARSHEKWKRPYTTNSISPHYTNTIERNFIGHVTTSRILTGYSTPWHTGGSRDNGHFSASWVGKSCRLQVVYIRGLHVMITDVQRAKQTMKMMITFTNVNMLLARNGAIPCWTRYTLSFILSWIQILWQSFVLVYVHTSMTAPQISWNVFPKDTRLHHTRMSFYSRMLLGGTILYAVKYRRNGNRFNINMQNASPRSKSLSALG
jgi:hypothetical protein